MTSWRASEPAAGTDVPVGAGYIRDNNAQIQSVLTATRLVAGTEIPDFFPLAEAIKLWFYANAVPTGWAEIGSIGDTLLAIKGGTTYTTGGDTAGAWQLPDHKLEIAEMPKHHHTYTLRYSENKNGATVSSTVGGSRNTGDTGGDQPHNHGDTYRPAARVGVVGTKTF